MAKEQSNGNSDTVTESGEGSEFDEIAFEQQLAKSDPALINSEEVPEDLSEETETEEEAEAEVVAEDESEEEESEEEETEEAEEEEEGEDVLSQIDFDALTDEQKQEIAEAVGSGAGKELGKLRREGREKDSKIESLEKQVDEGLSKMLPTSNAHSDIHTIADLDKKETEIEGSYRYLDNLLNGTEEFFEIQGKEVDRATAVSWKLHYEEQAKAIPAQRKAIKELESIQGLTNDEIEKAKAEVKFFADEESSQFKEWKKLTNDADFSLMARAFPSLGAKLARALAHSVAFQSKKPVSKIKLPRKKAKPINGTTGGAKTSQPNRGKKKQSDAMRKRFQSGEQTEEDIIASMNIS
jgi:hypothetical protein